MKQIQVDEHTISLSQSEVTYTSSEYDITLVLDTKTDKYNLRLTYDTYVIDEKIMTFYIESGRCDKYGHLQHLYIPSSIQGLGLGKLSLAIFYELLQLNNLSKFSMKFGGGSNSYSYLSNIGFDTKYLEVEQDSVFVGEYKNFGSAREWTLDPISINNYPTSFYTTK